MGGASHYDPDHTIIDPDDPSLLGLEELDDPLYDPSHRPSNLGATIQPDTPAEASRGRNTGLNNRDSNNAGGDVAGLSQNYLISQIPGEDRRASSNTIDESVWDTLRRDLFSVWEKMRQVLWPKYLLGGILARGGGIGAAERGEASASLTNGNGDEGSGGDGSGRGSERIRQQLRNLAGRWPDANTVLQAGMSEGLRDWDLWGPLLFCLLLAFLLSRGAQDAQKSLVFSGVFVIVWVGEAVVTLQIKLLGGNISFFQAICIIGYTLFPLVIAALLSALNLPLFVRLPVDVVLVLWSLAAGVSILGGSGVVPNRVALAVYPLSLFYLSLACLCLIS